MIRFVLDASFALSWVIENEQTPQALDYFNALVNQRVQAVVPALWADEVANVFLTLQRGKKMTSAQVNNWVELLSQLPIETDSPSIGQSLGEVRLLAHTHGLTAYDARYLHLAMRESLPLATRDKQLLNVAAKVGVKLIG